MTSAHPDLVLPAEWPPRRRLEALAREQRIVFLAGLPGVGKSLLVQQLTRMAHAMGRGVTLLQWDVARAAFETPEILARYPEIDGFTHAAVKRAVGWWARGAVREWHERHPGGRAMLIAESALIGDRLVELARPAPDAAEPLLAGKDLRFVVPVPTPEVRAVIERARDRTIAAPRHPRESHDAPPNVLRAIWAEVHREAAAMGLVAPAAPGTQPVYDHVAYGAVFARHLAARHYEIMMIDRVLDGSASAYHLGVPATDLVATPAEVAGIMTRIEREFPSSS